MNLVPFGSVCSLQNGRAFKPEEWSASGTPIVRIQNLNDETKPFNYCDFEVEKRFHVDSGDLLFSWSGTPGTSFGAFFWNRGKGFLNQHIFRVDIDERHVDKNYLRYGINSKLDLIIYQAHGGVGLKHITKGKLEAVEIPLPPLPEQKRIAAILDKADAIRRKRQQAIQLADDFLRAVFLDMFGDPVTNPKGWEVVTLNDVLDAIESGSSPKCDTRVASDGEWGVLKLGAVTTGVFLSSENKAIFSDYNPNPKHEVQQGDLLFTRKNTYDLVAAVALVEKKTTGLLLPDLIFRLCSKECIDKYFLWKLLSNVSIRSKVQALASGAAGSMPNISKANLKTVDVILPPMEEQIKFAEICRKTASLKNGNEDFLGIQGRIFSSLTQKAFRGEL